jgi:hypothetical protein
MLNLNENVTSIKSLVFNTPSISDKPSIFFKKNMFGRFRLKKIFDSLNSNSTVYIYKTDTVQKHPVGDLNPCCWNENPVS